jgi:hypothetical protein
MKISRGSLVAVVAVLAVAAILGSACAAPAAPPAATPPAPAPNQSPVVSKVTANPAQLVAGESSIITVAAADPDDDPITISWSASDGTISGTGSQVIWQSGKAGSANIGVTVKDNLGAYATGSVTITVLATTQTVTLNPVATETGTVDQKNATDYTRTRCGDDAANVGYRAFWSFDVGSLADKTIKKAELKFTTGTITGNPFSYMPPSGLGGLWLWKDTYGSQLPAFGYVGAKLIGTGLMYEPPSVVDVTTQVQLPVLYGNNRFQIEALWNKVSNGNITMDMIEWSSVVLEVTYYTK